MDKKELQIKLRKNIDLISRLQKSKSLKEDMTNCAKGEINITMSKFTLFFIIIFQIILVTLFFVLGFIVAWYYIESGVDQKKLSGTMQSSQYCMPSQPIDSEDNSIVKDFEQIK